MVTHRVEKTATPGGELPTSAATTDNNSATPGRSETLRQLDNGSPKEDWRDLAKQIQHETDPKKMLKLADRLIAQLDPGRNRRSEFPGK